MASAIKKVNMITQIVRLRQVVKRWKTNSLTRRYSFDAEASKRPTPPGSLAVYVGPERRRFVIPTRFLNLPVFVSLLRMAEEEFGFRTSGGLALPCDPGFFTKILAFLEEDEERFCGLGLDELSKMVSEMGMESFEQSSCKESGQASFTPLLHKTRVYQ
ncbi:protein SMALL AUXIN UP-REGULATED RNA 16-like [Primulina eburnea]|uniref:protein SMALL AUXIN UP-REGULATED RNA 16-like n=1 Tax=Primulina eburnea TaxID=1245227 RepID=UPI003C6C639A